MVLRAPDLGLVPGPGFVSCVTAVSPAYTKSRRVSCWVSPFLWGWPTSRAGRGDPLVHSLEQTPPTRRTRAGLCGLQKTAEVREGRLRDEVTNMTMTSQNTRFGEPAAMS